MCYVHGGSELLGSCEHVVSVQLRKICQQYSHHRHKSLAVARANTQKHSNAEMHLIIFRVSSEDAAQNQNEAGGKEDWSATHSQRKGHADKVAHSHEHGWEGHQVSDIGEVRSLCDGKSVSVASTMFETFWKRTLDIAWDVEAQQSSKSGNHRQANGRD